MNLLDWLSNWYQQWCNGEWEHDYGIVITTLDNPGWNVTIELIDTGLTLPDEEWKLFELSENDWYGYKVENNTFIASGDPLKLEFIIQLFKDKIDLLEHSN
ncbi:MAG: immunity 53 family protein [Flavobacteriales bacterium]